MATPLNQSIRSRVGTRRTHAILPRNKNFLRQFILQYIKLTFIDVHEYTFYDVVNVHGSTIKPEEIH